MLQAWKRCMSWLLVLVLLVQTVTPAFATETAEPDLTEVVGTAEITLNNYDENGNRLQRRWESNSGDFAADALYYLFDSEGLDVDAAIVSGGIVHNQAIHGQMTYETCRSIHSFGFSACLQTVTGQQLLDALEWGARATPDVEVGGLLQVSGVRYEVNASVPSTVQQDDTSKWTGAPTGGYRVHSVEVYDKESGSWQALDVTKQYRLAGYGYTIIDQGDGFCMFEGSSTVQSDVMADYMVLANYVKAFPDATVKAANSPLGSKYPGMGINYAAVTGDGRISVVYGEEPEPEPTELMILQQPQDVTVAEDESFAVTVVAQGDGLSYQWYWGNPDEGADFEPAENCTGPEYSFTMSPHFDGSTVYCVVTDQYGNQLQSDTATLTMVYGEEPEDPTGDISWSLENGVLTISGTGPMEDYVSYNSAPWYAQREEITSVVVEEGVTHVGDYAFNYLPITSVTLPVGLQSIGEEAFAWCRALTAVELPAGVQTIDSEAFSQCGKLSQVTVQEGLEHIGSRAFADCGLTEIVLPEGLLHIGESAFVQCGNLAKVILPDSLQSIGEYAFLNCYEIKELVLPKELQTIGNAAFQDCRLTEITIPANVADLSAKAFWNNPLQNIYVDENNDTYIDVDGVLFNKDKTKLVLFPANRTGSYDVPAGVDTIGEWAFGGSDLTSVVLPQQLRYIEMDAFSYALALEEIDLPKNVESIGDRAFYWCENMKRIIFQGDPPVVGSNVFYQCGMMRHRYYPCDNAAWTEEAMQNIGGNGTWVKKHYVEEGVCTGCSEVCEPIFAIAITKQPSSVTVKSGASAKVTVEAVGEGLTYQWYWAAPGSDEFTLTTSFTGPEYQVTMNADGHGRRVYCVITDKYGDQVTSEIATLAMTGKELPTILRVVTQPQSQRAAVGQKVTLKIKVEGDGLTYEWHYKPHMYLTGDDNYSRVNENFTGITYSFTMSEDTNGHTAYCVIYDKYGNHVATDEAEILLEGYERIMPGILTQPQDVSVPAGEMATVSLVAEGERLKYDWYWAPSGSDSFKHTTSFTGPEYSVVMNAERDGRRVYCVVSDVFGDSVTSRTVTLSMSGDGDGDLDEITPFRYVAVPGGVTITGYEDEIPTDLVIPATVDGLAVLNIGEWAFSGSNITSVTLPEGLQNILQGAFSTCDGLAEVIIPDSVQSVSANAFSGCSGLKNVQVGGGVTELAYRAFAFCESLCEVELGENLVSIADGVFYEDVSLEQVELPNTLEHVGDRAFFNNNFSQIVIPDSVTTIDYRAFGYGDLWDKDDDYRYDNFTIYGTSGSEAQRYANEHGFTFVEDAATHTHKMSDWSIAQESDCKTPGWMERACACGYTEEKALELKDHTVVDGVCSVCGKDLIVITRQPADVVVLEGETAAVTVEATGEGLTYAWYWAAPGSDDFTLTTSFTTNTYEITMNESRDGRRVYCEISDKYGNKLESDIATLSLRHELKITGQPESQKVPEGWTATATVDATGDGLSYEWFAAKGEGSFAATGVTAKSYSAVMSGAVDGTQLYCVVTDRYGYTATTKTITFAMAEKLEITRQPQNVVVLEGETAAVTVEATGEGLTYAWYWAAPGSDDFQLTTSFTTNTYEITMNESRDGRRVYCEISDKYGNKLESDIATLSLRHELKITGQPESQKVPEGWTATATVNATGDGLSYEWFAAKGEGSFAATGVTAKSYSAVMSGAVDGTQLYCVVTDQYGYTATTKTITFAMAEKLEITRQPQNVVVGNGRYAQTGVFATGEGLTYAWYWAAPGSDDFQLTTSFTSNGYSITMNESRDGRRVYCEVTDKYGNKLKSDIATLSMLPPPVITRQPQSVMVDDGETARVWVEVEGEGMKYQWYWANPGSTKFVKTNAYTTYEYTVPMTEDRAGRQVYCEVTDQYGMKTKSEVAVLGMNSEVIITKQPTDVMMGDNQKATVTMAATGRGLTYQWYWADAGSDDFALTTKFTSNSYAVTVNAERAGRQVYCVVTDRFGNFATTDVATIRMAKPITITRQPSAAYALKGEKATVSVDATGEGELSYAWYYAAAGSSSYQRASGFSGASYSATISDSSAGRKVYCVITDAYGQSVKTNTVTLRMQLSITEDLESVTAPSGKKASVTVKANGQGLKYAWYYSDDGENFKLTTSFKTATYSLAMNEARDGRQVFCRITDKYGNSVDSAIATLGMVPPPQIVVQPVASYARKGEMATVSFEAEGEGLSYQWYWAKAGSSTYKATDAFDGPEYSVEMDDSRAGRKVYCVVTDKYGVSVKSNTVTLRMELEITEDLTDVTVASGKKASVTVKANGQGLTYAWYYSDGGEFKLTTSFKTATYSLTMNEARDGRQVFCRITDKYGNTVDTAIATLGMK